ncbi:hypothetical protein IWZ03DRAFT_21879 [Phyllosticta citriasiana]|uniref:Uncharacterized protein n=1 Tax=Phyllosticta citriasiana TaxID=595635 RepID=A0ABR1L1J1_9PEZI
MRLQGNNHIQVLIIQKLSLPNLKRGYITSCVKQPINRPHNHIVHASDTIIPTCQKRRLTRPSRHGWRTLMMRTNVCAGSKKSIPSPTTCTAGSRALPKIPQPSPPNTETIIARKELNLRFSAMISFGAVWQTAWAKLNYGQLNILDVPYAHNLDHLGHIKVSGQIQGTAAFTQTRTNFEKFVMNLHGALGQFDSPADVYKSMHAFLTGQGVQHIPAWDDDLLAAKNMTDMERKTLEWQ